MSFRNISFCDLEKDVFGEAVIVFFLFKMLEDTHEIDDKVRMLKWQRGKLFKYRLNQQVYLLYRLFSPKTKLHFHYCRLDVDFF